MFEVNRKNEIESADPTREQWLVKRVKHVGGSPFLVATGN